MKDIDMSIINSVDIFKNNKSYLKELSLDTKNSEYMTESMTLAVNFDKVKTCYANSLNKSEECLSSVDALVELDERIVLIEFKNGKVKTPSVKHKMKDSLLLLCDILNTKISETREIMDYIVVYNKEKNNSHKKNKVQESKSRDDIMGYLADKADSEIVIFDLERYIDIFFKNIHTYDKQEFKDYLEKNKLYTIK